MEQAAGVDLYSYSGENERSTLKRGKIVPPSTVQAGRRKATSKNALAVHEDVNMNTSIMDQENSQNVAPRSGFKMQLSSKLMDFDIEGTKPAFLSTRFSFS